MYRLSVLSIGHIGGSQESTVEVRQPTGSTGSDGLSSDDSTPAQPVHARMRGANNWLYAILERLFPTRLV